MLKNWWKYLLILLGLLIAVGASAIVWVNQNQERVINELLVELNKKQPGKYEITGSHGNMTKVAKELGIGRTTLYRKIEKYNI